MLTGHRVEVAVDRFWTWVCNNFHRRITRPVNHEYTCLVCGRTTSVEW